MMRQFQVTMKNINAGLPNAKLQDGERYEAVLRGRDEVSVSKRVVKEQLDRCGMRVDNISTSDGTIFYFATYGKSQYGRFWLHIAEVEATEEADPIPGDAKWISNDLVESGLRAYVEAGGTSGRADMPYTDAEMGI